MRSIAERAGIIVVAGMFTPTADGRVTNTLIAAGPGVDTHYHKIHLYDAFGFVESRTVAPGHEPVVITVDGVEVGLTTCYDIRFPELYVELARRGAQVITVHASWGSGPGKLEQWTLLARARALDTTGVIAAVGQAYPGDEIAAAGPTGVGWQPGRLTHRHGAGIGRRRPAVARRRYRSGSRRNARDTHRGVAQPLRVHSCR